MQHSRNRRIFCHTPKVPRLSPFGHTLVLKPYYPETMKRKQNQITITAIVVFGCLASIASACEKCNAANAKKPKHETLSSTGNILSVKEIVAMPTEDYRKTIQPAKRVWLRAGKRTIKGKALPTNVTSGNAKQIADNVIVSYINNSKTLLLKDIIEDLSFLMGINIVIDNDKVKTLGKDAAKDMPVAYQKEMVAQFGKLVSDRTLDISAGEAVFYGRNLNRTGVEVLVEIAHDFRSKVVWENDRAVIIPNLNHPEITWLPIESAKNITETN